MSVPIRTALLLAALAGLAAGCVSDATLTEDLLAEANATEASAPLGGEALLQRKLELDRALRDLGHFQATLVTLGQRGNRGSDVLFREFVDFYLGMHVLPLLEGEWQSRHPEVAVLDAGVRLVVAELWHRMGRSSMTDRMLAEIARRFEGRHTMIVSYPVGDQSTLLDAVDHLRAL